jgi:hypothetical protein
MAQIVQFLGGRQRYRFHAAFVGVRGRLKPKQAEYPNLLISEITWLRYQPGPWGDESSPSRYAFTETLDKPLSFCLTVPLGAAWGQSKGFISFSIGI